MSMLGLKLPTDPRWVNVAEKSIEDILVDHAWCEQKAATSCISLIVHHFNRKKLVDVLSPVVKEEWAHFDMVIRELDKRGFDLGKPRKDEYVMKLIELKIKGGSKEQRLIDDLLVNALIEARSCERFRILSQHISDDSLKDFYHKLMISEAGHYVNFIELAKEYMDEEYVKNRLEEFLIKEAEIVANLEIRGDRVH